VYVREYQRVPARVADSKIARAVRRSSSSSVPVITTTLDRSGRRHHGLNTGDEPAQGELSMGLANLTPLGEKVSRLERSPSGVRRLALVQF
jgi:hypothetical protein